jgi:hypothetical protein
MAVMAGGTVAGEVVKATVLTVVGAMAVMAEGTAVVAGGAAPLRQATGATADVMVVAGPAAMAAGMARWPGRGSRG